MSPNKPLTIACVARAAAASAVFATFATIAAAHAQMMEPARIVAPLLTPIAAPAALPSATRAVIAAPPREVTPSALPQDTPAAPPATCRAPTELTYLDRPLIRTARRLASGQPLTVVAIGSSSTAGAGASSPDATYPSQLAVDLKQRFPGEAITVLNRGVNGEETENMMARFAGDVIAAHPQLVLWQVGTNSVLRDRPLAPHEVQLREGIDELKATGADVMLIDPQYSPKVIAKSETDGMVEQIAVMAKEENIDLFQRFAVMRNWSQVQHLGFDTFVSPDGLHMNDWSYACLAKLLAGSIAEAATRPVASAAAHGHLPR